MRIVSTWHSGATALQIRGHLRCFRRRPHFQKLVRGAFLLVLLIVVWVGLRSNTEPFIVPAAPTVSFQLENWPLIRLDPYEGKLPRTVLRGASGW